MFFDFEWNTKKAQSNFCFNLPVKSTEIKEVAIPAVDFGENVNSQLKIALQFRFESRLPD